MNQTKFSQLSEEDQYNLSLLLAALKEVVDPEGELNNEIVEILGEEIVTDLVYGVLNRVIESGPYSKEEHISLYTSLIKKMYSKGEQ